MRILGESGWKNKCKEAQFIKLESQNAKVEGKKKSILKENQKKKMDLIIESKF